MAAPMNRPGTTDNNTPSIPNDITLGIGRMAPVRWCVFSRIAWHSTLVADANRFASLKLCNSLDAILVRLENSAAIGIVFNTVAAMETLAGFTKTERFTRTTTTATGNYTRTTARYGKVGVAFWGWNFARANGWRAKISPCAFDEKKNPFIIQISLIIVSNMR